MYYFIVNPVAGNGKALESMEKISTLLQEQNVPFTVLQTKKPGDGQIVASSLKPTNEDVVIFVGGDGTLNECFKGIKDKKNTKIGIIPAGTGNDFCFSVSIGNDPIKNMKKILNGTVHSVDYVEGLDGNISLNTMSTGLDIDVIERYNRAKKKTSGTYTRALLKTLLAFKFKDFEITVDGKQISGKYMLAAVCNGNKFGGGMMASPLSDVKDGKVNLVLIKKVCRLLIPFRLMAFLKGKHIGKKFTEHILCERVKITGKNGALIPSNYDGELVYKTPIDLHIVKGGMKLVF